MLSSEQVLGLLAAEVARLRRVGGGEAVVAADQRLDSIGLDSLDFLEMAMTLEQQTGVVIELEHLAPTLTLAEASERIAALQQA